MSVYITSFAISILFAFISDKIKRMQSLLHSRKRMIAGIIAGLFAFLSFMPLTIVSAIRYNVGSDYIPYANVYRGRIYRGYEPGFVLLCELLHRISNDPQIFFVVTSCIICAGYYIAIYRASQSPIYSIFLFFSPLCFFASLSLIRQQIATVFLLNALIEYNRDKKLSALVLAISAVLFHYSAIFFIIAFVIVDNLKISPLKGVILLLASALIARIFSDVIKGFLIQHSDYGRYYGRNDADAFMSVLLIFPCFYAMLAYEYRNVVRYKSMHTLFSSIFIGLVVGFSVSVLFMPANRLMYYSDAVLVLYVPEAISLVKNKVIRWMLYIFVTVGYLFRTIYYFYSTFFRAFYIPYQTMWG